MNYFGGPKTRPQVVPGTVILGQNGSLGKEMAAKTLQEHPQSCKRHLRAPQDPPKTQKFKDFAMDFSDKKGQHTVLFLNDVRLHLPLHLRLHLRLYLRLHLRFP